MSVAPHAGIIDFGTFTPPDAPKDGIQGEVPAPLVAEIGYILSTNGWVPAGGGGGAVTDVTATAPVTSSGGATPNIAIPAATASVSGYLTSSDWTSFNNKQPSGAYLTTVTSDTPLTGSGTTGSHLSIPAATSSINGYLTSTDWNIFNNKGSVSSVSGTGSVNGLTLTGTVTSSGNLTLGGAITGFATSGANTNLTSVALTTGTISTAPASSTDIVNKSYADSIASGVNFHAACQYATDAALATNTYNNGASGVGATLTAVLNGALVIDGHTFTTPDIGARVLIKNEVTQANNGVYTVTAVGGVSAVYVLTRATDYDTSGSGTNEVDQGDLLLVINGTVNANTSWVQQTPLPITIGTTALVFLQFAAVQTYTAGTGLTLATNQFSITDTGTAGTYGSASLIPVITTNAQGQVTGVTTAANPQGTVTSVATANGTGISVTGSPITSSGTLTITNTAPDQTVAFTNGTGISVTGTYPNFTITNTASAGSGTVTSVAALTLGTTGTDLSSTVANSTTTPVITLQVPTASAANRGALSSTDWSTFNGKQAALGYTPVNKAGDTMTGALNLVAGTASVAPLGFQTGTNLTTAATGSMEFDGTVPYFSIAASTRGAIPTEQWVVLTSTNTLTSQTGVQPIFDGGGGPTNGSVTLPVGTYQFECVYALTAMSATSGSFGFALGGAATKTYSYDSTASKAGTAATTAQAGFKLFSSAAATALVTASTGTVGSAVIKGIIRVTVAGTVIPQVSLTVASAAIVSANSYFRVSPIGNATVATVGNWS